MFGTSVVSEQTPLELVKSVGLVGVEVQKLTQEWKKATRQHGNTAAQREAASGWKQHRDGGENKVHTHN